MLNTAGTKDENNKINIKTTLVMPNKPKAHHDWLGQNIWLFSFGSLSAWRSLFSEVLSALEGSSSSTRLHWLNELLNGSQ